MGMMRAILAKVQRLEKQKQAGIQNNSLADVGRCAIVAEFSDQLFVKKDTLSIDLECNSKIQEGPYHAHSRRNTSSPYCLGSCLS